MQSRSEISPISGVFQVGKRGTKDSDESKFIFCHLMLLDVRFKRMTINIPDFRGECPSAGQLLDPDAQQMCGIISP